MLKIYYQNYNKTEKCVLRNFLFKWKWLKKKNPNGIIRNKVWYRSWKLQETEEKARDANEGKDDVQEKTRHEKTPDFYQKKKKKKKTYVTETNANSIERKRRSRTTHSRLSMHTCLLWKNSGPSDPSPPASRKATIEGEGVIRYSWLNSCGVEG